MKRNEILLWGVVLTIAWVGIWLTTHSLWGAPAGFTGGYFIGTWFFAPRPSSDREWPEKYETR